MRITVLGCGTSTGVPVPGCSCEACSSTDPLNQRLRVSVLIEVQKRDLAPSNEDSAAHSPTEQESVVSRILIDTSTDLRQQALRYQIPRIDAVLYTHTHADHIFGLDDLRSYNFTTKMVIPLYATPLAQSELRRMFQYVFSPDPNYKGAPPPQVSLNNIEPYCSLNVAGVDVLPLALFHGPEPIVGFRIGKFAYLTDCSQIPDRTFAALDGLELLIIDGLRYRKHPTHFTIEEAVAEVEKIKPKQAFLTHLSHDVEYHSANRRIAELTKQAVQVAYDGLTITL